MIGATVKVNKFDAPGVQARMDKKTYGLLSRIGRFTQRRDQTSQKRRKKTRPGAKARKNAAQSKPGGPPLAILGHVRDNTFFAVDDTGGVKSVVIGPVKLSKRNKGAPRVLEEGGNVTLIVGDGKQVRASYDPHPHTLPAFQTELRKLRAMWGIV